MWRPVKLFINLLITAFLFNYFISILVLLLNPSYQPNFAGYSLLFQNLAPFYVPFWFVTIGIIFFLVQFLSEKKYPIGFFKIPTLIYFLSFTIIILSFIYYFNYDHYFNFFPAHLRTRFIKILMINLTLITSGLIYMFVKKVNRNWTQILFYILLTTNIFYSYASVHIEPETSGYLPANNSGEILSQDTSPRKIRIVIMNGLSLDFIRNATSQQQLMNFNFLKSNGVWGNISSSKPHTDLSMQNSLLTGLKPSEFNLHSNWKYRFSKISHKFDVTPRYILFSLATRIKSMAYFNDKYREYLDHLNRYYLSNRKSTTPLVKLSGIRPYSEKSVNQNNLFVHLFSDILNLKNRKYDIVRKAFFYDDYLKSINHELKDTNQYYCLMRFPGLEIISKHFYHYHFPQTFGNITEEDIKKYGWIVKKYYEYYDSIVGNMISTTGDNELLVVISFFEYEPLPLWRRIIENLIGKKDIYVFLPAQSKGTIFLYEKNAIKKDYPLQTISIYDIFPTIAYYAGFQLSKELEGEIIREIFTDEFVLNNPTGIHTNDSQ